MDDPALAGGTFRINLISPEGEESGDRRTFVPGTTDFRDLPLPLLWQWQLADGHKNAVVVGRIDHIERTPKGLGNARGVFDSGPWGREAERMVRARMVRGVSGDYSSFTAKILEKAEPDDQRIIDDKISVDRSRLVAATIVAKPAFEDCYIEIVDDDELLPNGIIEAPLVLTAAALRLVRPDMVARLERLEQLEAEQLALIASATTERVSQLRLHHDRDAAVARIQSLRNVTAAFKPMPSSWLSAKAKLQPRDALGRWIDMGATVRWRHGHDSIGGVKRGHSKGTGHAGGGAPFRQGRVTHFDANTGDYTVEPLDGGPSVKLKGPDVEVVKAVIPSSPDEAKKISADMPGHAPDANAPNAPHPDVPNDTPAPDAYFSDPESLIKASEDHKKSLDAAIAASKTDDPAIKEVGLDRLAELTGAQIESGDEPFLSNHGIAKAEKKDAKLEKTADQWPDRETLGQQLFNNLQAPGETWEKDGEKYMAAGDRLRLLSESRLISDKRRQWIKNTYGKDASPIPSQQSRKDESWSTAFGGDKAAEEKSVVPLAEKLNNLWGDAETDAPSDPSAKDDLWSAAKSVTSAPAKQDAVQKLGGDIVKAQQEKNAPKDDPLAAHDKALAEGNQWSDKPKITVPQFGSNQSTKTVTAPPADNPAAPDAPAPDPRAELQKRAGLSDEEMATAPELLPSVENFRNAVTDANFLSAKDLADFNDYLDEVQVAPGGRSAGQWDSIDEFLQDRSQDGTISDQGVLDTLSAARKDSLDSPGDTTIADLEKPASKTALPDDLPDTTDDALTVPEDWKISKPDEMTVTPPDASSEPVTPGPVMAEKVPELSTSGGSTRREMAGAVYSSSIGYFDRKDLEKLIADLPEDGPIDAEKRAEIDKIIGPWKEHDKPFYDTMTGLLDRYGQPVEQGSPMPVVPMKSDAHVFDQRNSPPYGITPENLDAYRSEGVDAIRGHDVDGDWMIVLNPTAVEGAKSPELKRSSALDQLAKALDDQAGKDWIEIPTESSTGKKGSYRIPRSVAESLIGNRQESLGSTDDLPTLELDKKDMYYVPPMKESRPLSESETTALDKYTMQGKSLDINGYLRTDGKAAPVNYDGDIKADINALDSAIDAHTIDDDVHVYRGLASSALGKGPLEPGSIIQDKGFLSTSSDSGAASTFARVFGDESTILEIAVPKGSTGYATQNDARETILPRNSRLVVEEVGQRRGQRLVKARLEQNETPAGNVTEFAKNMFQNRHPDANWDTADQTKWMNAAKKAMEKPND
jgi:hypothetical protein